jgi:hypothetical protein
VFPTRPADGKSKTASRNKTAGFIFLFAGLERRTRFGGLPINIQPRGFWRTRRTTGTSRIVAVVMKPFRFLQA